MAAVTAGSLGKKAAKIDAVSGAILSVFQLVPLVGSTVSGLSKVNKLQGKYLRACSFGHLDQSGVLPHTSTRRSPNSLERRVKSLGTRLSEVETVNSMLITGTITAKQKVRQKVPGLYAVCR